MKKVFRTMTIVMAAALASLALFGCGGETKQVSYDGTYRALDGDYYKFIVIKGNDMAMYYGESDAFAAAVKLDHGDFTLTVRNEEGITAVNDDLNYTKEYADGNMDGTKALIDETLDLSFVKI